LFSDSTFYSGGSLRLPPPFLRGRYRSPTISILVYILWSGRTPVSTFSGPYGPASFPRPPVDVLSSCSSSGEFVNSRLLIRLFTFLVLVLFPFPCSWLFGFFSRRSFLELFFFFFFVERARFRCGNLRGSAGPSLFPPSDSGQQTKTGSVHAPFLFFYAFVFQIFSVSASLLF